MTTTYLSFNSRENAEKFIGALIDHGASTDDISVIARESGATLSGEDVEAKAAGGITTTTAADFGKGAMAGTGVGLGLGVAVGLASLLVPGFGLVLGAGALSSAIAGAVATTAGGALVGGVAGYLRDLGVEGEVPDEFERDFVADHVIVGVNSRADGITLADIEAMAEKYHATRTTLNRTTVAAVPVDTEVVKKPIMDPVTGEPALTTTEIREPVGAAQIETIPVAPVVPIPGTNQLQPMLPREPDLPSTVEPPRQAVVTAHAERGVVETTEISAPQPGARVESVEVRPAIASESPDMVDRRVTVDEQGVPIEGEQSVQPTTAVKGDVYVEKTVAQAPPTVERTRTVHAPDGSTFVETTEEPLGHSKVSKVVVDPIRGVTEREIIEPDEPVEAVGFLDAEPEDEPTSDPTDRFYKA